jgi:hypothetical protein
MAETDAAVIVDFVDLAPGYFNPVIVAVMPLPPALAAGGAITEAVVRPGFQNFSNHVLAVIKAERDRDFNIAAGGDLYLPTEIFRHGIRCPSRIMLPVVRLYVNDGVIYVTHPLNPFRVNPLPSIKGGGSILRGGCAPFDKLRTGPSRCALPWGVVGVQYRKILQKDRDCLGVLTKQGLLRMTS